MHRWFVWCADGALRGACAGNASARNDVSKKQITPQKSLAVTF
jgi:hypothetical protein